MSTKPLVRFIESAETPAPEIHDEIEFPSSPNRWSTSVRSWVVEFQKRNRTEPLPAFDGLFKDALLERAPAD